MRSLSSIQRMFAEQDSPYELNTKLEPGTRYEATPPYPDVTVTQSDVIHVRELVYHTVAAELRDITTENKQNISIGRLVAVLEGGDEVEIHRVVLPADVEEEGVDLSVCGSCGGKIKIGGAHMHEGRAYHHRCLRD